MRRSTRRGLLIIVFTFSATQFMYLYYYGDHTTRIQKLASRFHQYQGHLTANTTAYLFGNGAKDLSVHPSGNTAVRTTAGRLKPNDKKLPSLPVNSSEAIFPPLLYNMEMYFHSPYKPLLYGKRRTKKGLITIGIPSVRRPNTNKMYIFETIDSLINKTKETERAEINIVIYMCDTNKTYNSIVSQDIYSRYQEYCDRGFIQIIQGSADIYPDLSKVKQTFNDPAPRIKWRAKQNIDFAFLTLYSRNLSSYYMQLEDDVITASDYVSDIQKFIYGQRKPWFLLEFTNLGFIGKLFHSEDLDRVAFYLLSFYDRMPCDLLLGHIRKLMGQDKPIHSKKSLFQHIGKFSSLKNKLMPSIDKDFKDAGSVHLSINDIPRGDNPPAKILTDLQQYADNEVAYAYDNSDKIFWARDVKKNQHLTLLFRKPQQISRIIIATGDPNTKGDSLVKSSLSVAVRNDVGRSPTDLHDCGEFKKLADLVDGDLDTKALGLGKDIPPGIICLKIKVEKTQRTWVIFRNISIMLK